MGQPPQNCELYHTVIHLFIDVFVHFLSIYPIALFPSLFIREFSSHLLMYLLAHSLIYSFIHALFR